jgi:Flp pilus assembly protein TadB
MNLLTTAVAGGAACGLGALTVVGELLPERPHLARALARLDEPAVSVPAPSAPPGTTAMDRLQQWLAGRLDRVPVPSADLRLLRRPVEAHLTAKVAFALLGFLLPVAVLTVLALVGLGLPLAVPVVVSVACAVGFFFVPDLVLGSQAEAARAEFRQAVGAYLELVALERAADGGPADALERAATVGRGWAFTRISDALARARLVGVPPWRALAQLAEEIGADDLRDLADIVALAGEDGAAIYDTLAAKAASLRARSLADAEAAANASSEKLTLPAVGLGLGFLLLVCYPALARVLI